jgi:hypothetical protein
LLLLLVDTLINIVASFYHNSLGRCNHDKDCTMWLCRPILNSSYISPEFQTYARSLISKQNLDVPSLTLKRKLDICTAISVELN